MGKDKDKSKRKSKSKRKGKDEGKRKQLEVILKEIPSSEEVAERERHNVQYVRERAAANLGFLAHLLMTRVACGIAKTPPEFDMLCYFPVRRVLSIPYERYGEYCVSLIKDRCSGIYLELLKDMLATKGWAMEPFDVIHELDNFGSPNWKIRSKITPIETPGSSASAED